MLPSYKSLHREKGDLGDLYTVERRADLVLTLRDGDTIKAGIILEVQLQADNRKFYQSPAAAASLHAELNLARFDPKTNTEKGTPIPVYLVFLTFSEATAQWAQAPIKTLLPNSALQFLVIGPSAIPRIETAQAAKKNPEMALISAMAHARRPKDIAVVAAAFEGISSIVDPERGNVYLDYLAAVLSDPLKNHLEKLMNIDPNTFQFRSTTFRKLLQDMVDIEANKIATKAAADAAEAKAKERLISKREDLLELIKLRQLALKAPEQKKIEACDDMTTIATWFANAATAATIQEVFQVKTSPTPTTTKKAKK